MLVPSLGSGHSFELCKACLQILALLALVALSRRGENVIVVLYVIRLLDGVVRDVGGVGRGTRARVCRPNRYMCVYRERERVYAYTAHVYARGGDETRRLGLLGMLGVLFLGKGSSSLSWVGCTIVTDGPCGFLSLYCEKYELPLLLLPGGGGPTGVPWYGGWEL